MSALRPYAYANNSIKTLRRPDFSSQSDIEEHEKQRHAANARNRDLDALKYNALAQMGGHPCQAKYLGTRRKDGWHYMEVRLRASFQSRTYVNPKHVTWKGDPPEIKWGDKVKDFL